MELRSPLRKERGRRQYANASVNEDIRAEREREGIVLEKPLVLPCINFFNINFLPPTQNPEFWAPEKKVMCLISWERTQKRDPHKLFRGGFWGQNGGPKPAIFSHKKFSLLFFLGLTKS